MCGSANKKTQNFFVVKFPYKTKITLIMSSLDIPHLHKQTKINVVTEIIFSHMTSSEVGSQ
jgi:hypothetical protein